MKKFIKKIIVILALIIMPVGVLAEGEVSVSPNSLTLEVGETKTFTITAVNTSGSVTISSNKTDVATINKSEWDTGIVSTGETKTETITVTGVTVGTATITITINATTLDDEDLSGQTRTVSVTVKRTSTNNNLSSIKINGNLLGNFNPSVTTYNIDTEESSVNIVATPEDTKARVTGGGLKALSFGNNKIELKVTAESGSAKTYTLNINRRDTRDPNNSLLSLTIDKGTLEFDKSKTTYNVEVESDIDKVTINAIAESARAQITGHGLINLKYGNNKVEIKVTSETGSTKVYTININRKDSRDTNNNLINLMIDKGTLLFDKSKTSYNLDVNSNVERIIISATPESEKATVNGTGEKTLIVGNNKFEIKVTAENENVKVYTVIVNRLEPGNDPIPEYLIDSLSIENIDFAFDPSVSEYNIPLSNNRDKLVFEYSVPEDVTVSIEGNENLKNGSTVIFKVAREEKIDEYNFNISKIEEPKKAVKISLKGKWKWIVLGILSILLIVGTIAKSKDKKKKAQKESENTPEDIDTLLSTQMNIEMPTYGMKQNDSGISNEMANDFNDASVDSNVDIANDVSSNISYETNAVSDNSINVSEANTSVLENTDFAVSNDSVSSNIDNGISETIDITSTQSDVSNNSNNFDDVERM